MLSTPCASCSAISPRAHQAPPEIPQCHCGLSAVLSPVPLGDISSIWSNSLFHWQLETSLNKYGNTFKRDFYNSSPSSSTQTLQSAKPLSGVTLNTSSWKSSKLTNIKCFFFSLVCTFLLYSDQHKGLYLFFQESLDLGRKIYIPSHFLYFGFLTTAFLFPRASVLAHLV